MIHKSFVLKYHDQNVLFGVFIQYLYTLKHSNDKVKSFECYFLLGNPLTNFLSDFSRNLLFAPSSFHLIKMLIYA